MPKTKWNGQNQCTSIQRYISAVRYFQVIEYYIGSIVFQCSEILLCSLSHHASRGHLFFAHSMIYFSLCFSQLKLFFVEFGSNHDHNTCNAVLVCVMPVWNTCAYVTFMRLLLQYMCLFVHLYVCVCALKVDKCTTHTRLKLDFIEKNSMVFVLVR